MEQNGTTTMATSESTSVRPQVRRIAVIGAGQSGLCVIRHFAADPAYKVVAFEQQGRIGGLWNYPEDCEEHEDVGQDDTSPYFCRMYRNLKGNASKFHQQYAGDVDLHNEMEMFPSRQTMSRYLSAYADRHNLRKCVKFRHVVQSVTPYMETAMSTSTPSGQRWKLTSCNLDSNADTAEIFDVVIICNGQYRKLYVPKITTIENFQGTVLHSGQYRDAENYRNQNVLVVGSGVSANELTCGLFETAKNVFVVRRVFRDIFADRKKFPNIFLVPVPLQFVTEGLMLENGNFQPIDTVILCTGYMSDFLFLTPECGVQYSRGHSWPLYRHMINCNYPTMAFIGCIQKMIPVMPVVEDQAKYYKAWLDGVFILPSPEEMEKDCEADYAERLAEGMLEHNAHEMRPTEQRLYGYLDLLAKEAKFEPWSAAMRGIFLFTSGKLVTEPCSLRSYRFTIVDEDNFLVDKVDDQHSFLKDF